LGQSEQLLGQALKDLGLPREYPAWMIETQGKYRAVPPVRE
jgi:hypothetical protein